MAGERYIYTEQKATPSKGGDGVASDDFSKNAESSKGTRRLSWDHVDHASDAGIYSLRSVIIELLNSHIDLYTLL